MTSTNNTKETAPNLKTTWEPNNFITVNRAIKNYIRTHYLTAMHENVQQNLGTAISFEQISDLLGLAYTSSSTFAMYSICNTELYFDFGQQWHFVCFGLAEGNSGFVYALLHDKEENEIYFPIN